MKKGPLKGFNSWWQFRARYAEIENIRMGQLRFQKVTGYQNLDELTSRFAPYVLRRTKAECLDLPPKSYVVREVALSESTWRIYQELKKEAMLALPDSEERPEPNAAVRLLRLSQLTSGHVGGFFSGEDETLDTVKLAGSPSQDVSSEKLDWLAEQILTGELVNERALIVWMRWRRERERLAAMLTTIAVTQIHGAQSQKERDMHITEFQSDTPSRVVMLAQPHAGGFGLTLTAASTAVYLSLDFSYTTRVQSEDRCHRSGQDKAVTYVDVLATSPKGAKTIDHYILDCLKKKQDVATLTCSAWKRILRD
jgi:SNF2 family DNA or RNA helicase